MRINQKVAIVMHMEMKGIVFGALVSKSNSRQIVRRGNRIASIKSSKGLAYESSAIMQLTVLKLKLAPPPPFLGDLTFTATIYYPSRRNDLDCSLFQDCLQKAGVIGNDRQLKEIHLYHGLDKLNPRVEFSITKL